MNATNGVENVNTLEPSAVCATAPCGKTKAQPQVRSLSFYTTMGVVAILVAITGFTGAGILNDTAPRALTGLVYLHGAVFGGWLIFFVVQARLVAIGNRMLHRRTGWIGAGLAVLVLVVGAWTSIVAAQTGYDLGRRNDPLAQLVFPLGDLLSFAILVGAGLWFRNRADIHKRLMLLATAGSMMGAPLAHLFSSTAVLRALPPMIIVPLALLLFSSAIHDKLKRGRMHPVSLWGAIALFVWANLRAAVIGPSEAWHTFAAWLIG